MTNKFGSASPLVGRLLYGVGMTALSCHATTAFSQSAPIPSGQSTASETSVNEVVPLASTRASPADAPSSAAGEIIVTAQRRAERLQDVPLSISAFSSDTLNRKNITDITAITNLEPGTQVTNNQQRVEITIRGIGASSVIGFFEQPVAIHVDGFYQARASGIGANFFDVDRVEVLKGPQGTLYGRNATGGAVNIITKKPADDFSIEARLEGMALGDTGHGTDTGWSAGAVVNLPISDDIQTRFSVLGVRRGGYKTIINQNNQKFDGDNARNISARGQVKSRLGNKLSWLVSGDYYHANDRSAYYEELGPSRPDVPLTGVVFFGGRNCGKCRTRYSDYPIATRITNWGATSTLSYDLGNDTVLKALTQFRRTKYFSASDFDGVEINLGSVSVPSDSKQFSQELQLTGATRRLKYVVGGYYFRERINIGTKALFPILPDDPVLGPQGVLLAGRITTDAYSAFAEGTYDLTDKLSVTAGGRYNREIKGGANNVRNNFPAFGLTSSFVGPVPDIGFNSFTPKIGLNYKPSRHTLAYASFTKGFKSGGYNIGNSPSNAQGILADSFKPEKVDAFEAGLKADALQRHLQLSVAAFYYKYSALQLNVIVDNATLIQNSGPANIYGIEGSVVARPIDDLSISLSGTLMHPKFKESNVRLTDPLYPERGPQDVGGNFLPRAPKLTASMGIDYTAHVGNGGTLVPSFNASYKSHQYFSAFNDLGIEQGGYWWLKASMTYNLPGGKNSVTVYGDNLTNALAYTALFPGTVAFGYPLAGITTEGPTYGIRLNAKF